MSAPRTRSTAMSTPAGATGAPRRELHLAAFFPFGPHYDWTSVADPTTYYDAETYATLARSAERGLFSAMFLGDSQRLREHLGRVNDTVVTGRPNQLVLFAHLAARTRHLGFVATLNTTFAAPADLAARVATVDRLSGRRAGWNVVTTNDAWTGANFRRGGYLPRSERYRSAEEHLAIVHALWDADRGTPVRRTGAHHDVVATATLPPSAQGAPVIFQAGESDEGRDFAARHAEGIFSRYLEPEAAAAFAADLRRRLVAHGRPADDLRIFPAASITLGDTEAEAREKAEWFHRRTWTDRMVVAVIEAVWGRDLSWLDPDGPLPDVDPASAEQTRTPTASSTAATTPWRLRPRGAGQRRAGAHRARPRRLAARGGRVRRDTVVGRRPPGGVRAGRGARRPQPHAPVGPRRVRRRRGPARARAPGTWRLPHPLPRDDVAREPRPARARPPPAPRHGMTRAGRVGRRRRGWLRGWRSHQFLVPLPLPSPGSVPVPGWSP
ncbi:LLM class flavin-dependent oxidoreductase [Cellulosimicrobium protaetiae]|uniref:LLM class flavin-dependent oxidoreductase n=1 Tax=Cellulosimicrobium protaetiae TaxID=2587808 RepID=UPI001C10CAEE|nr:LLM class flavin-dependent oxidoreductase [Cellulosimicrobium protaetiae]